MNQPPGRRPGRPRSATPPDGLIALVDTFKHANVAQVGLTTTEQGEWALLLRVPKGTPTPLEGVTAKVRFPIVYEEVSDEPAKARPAYPRRGE
jgi:hypothetical protein